MRRNLMTKIVNCLSSWKCRRAVLCSLGMAVAFGMACALILPAAAVDSAAKKSAAPEPAEINDTYEAETDKFVTVIHVENTGHPEPAESTEGRRVLLASAGVPLAALPEETGIETDGETGGEVAFQVTEVTEGERYEALTAQLPADPGRLATQVMEVTAFKGEQELNLSGCEITMQVTPTPELLAEAGTDTGMSVTVLPLGGEAKTESFTSEEVNSGEPLPVTVTYTVPEDGTVMYAISSRAGGSSKEIKLTEDGAWNKVKWVDTESGEEIQKSTTDTGLTDKWLFVPAGESWQIDLNGHTVSQTDRGKDEIPKSLPEDLEFLSLIYVEENATLTIIDSRKTEDTGETEGSNETEDTRKKAGIATKDLASLVWVGTGGTLNIQGGELKNEGDRVVLALGTGTVNMSGGTITGAIGKTWGGGGIYAEQGTVTITGGVITKNNAAIDGSGGGIYSSEGTVTITGGEITHNSSGVYGGGIYSSGGTVNISGDCEIKNNSAAIGGGIYAGQGKVIITGGMISENHATSDWSGGGGVWAKMVDMSGGTISGNDAFIDGGGIYVDEGKVTLTGGTICNNIANRDGGGIYAPKGKVTLSNGTISGNESGYSGGGVWTNSMEMAGGTISDNNVYRMQPRNYNPRGGGGIYIASRKTEEGFIYYDSKDTVYKFYDSVEGSVECNMSITGGTIEGNTSSHTGGGIFVDVKAVAYIRGEKGKPVNIKGNTAYDNDSGQSVHGYAGGGIFVEHPDNASDAKNGGEVYIYNAVITENTALYGGGVAGCGSSSVTICSVNGVAVYGNKASDKESGDKRRGASDDLYVDGSGTVDSKLMEDVQVSWSGYKKTKAGVTVDEADIQKVEITSGAEPFEHGFYLHIDKLEEADKRKMENNAAVVIKENTSGSGGGGVGGNGFMKMGLKSPDPEKETYKLELKKIVIDPKNSSGDQEFSFTIQLTDSEGNSLTGDYLYKLNDGNASTIDLSGPYSCQLGNNDCITIEKLPEGTKYTITEASADGYRPGIEVVNFGGKTDLDGTVASGEIGTGTSVTFTNTACYELPETGGVTPTMYYMSGLALLAMAMAGGWTYKRRSR